MLAKLHGCYLTALSASQHPELCCAVQVLTNGLYTPTLHRVLNTAASTPRVSVPFFYEPCYEAVVQPLPQFCR